jgi:bifunctional non-homologous end joining protein LigD
VRLEIGVALVEMSETESIRPQQARRANADISSVDWVFEPCWRGERLVARVTDGSIVLTDVAGQPVDEAYAEAAEVILPAVDAQTAMIDGIWTAMPFAGEGSAARVIAEQLRVEGLEEDPDPIAIEKRRAFVAIDLLELDGQSLIDIPLLERRRLLASVVEESVRVRVSPAVSQPYGRWLPAWRLNGFTHYLAKHVNSRYAPGEVNPDWIQIETEPRTPSAIGRLFGQRSRTLRIER